MATIGTVHLIGIFAHSNGKIIAQCGEFMGRVSLNASHIFFHLNRQFY